MLPKKNDQQILWNVSIVKRNDWPKDDYGPIQRDLRRVYFNPL